MWSEMLFHSCLNLLFPPRCAVCNVHQSRCGEIGLCQECRGRVQEVEGPLCSICGMELYAHGVENPICGECLTETPSFEFARSLFYYNDEIRALLSKLKYKKNTSVLPAISELVKVCDLSAYNACDYIIPVPLHKKRLQQRGFNQALLLAKICFGCSNAQINTTILRRTRNTVPQVTLDGQERRKSLKNAFAVSPDIEMSGTTVCLIDDVYTTGTTVSECSKALLSHGADKVIVLTLARVNPPRRGRGLG